MCGICCVCHLVPASDATSCPFVDMGYVESHSFIPRRGPDVQRSLTRKLWSSVQTLFSGFVLHLRGTVTPQPLTSDDGDILLWNGEIFDGIKVRDDENDTQVLLQRLTHCESQGDILTVLQSVRGPWSLIFWQARTERLWFGRDVFGRRSLLWHLPQDDGVFALSSVPITPMDFVEVPSVGVFCMELSSQPWDNQDMNHRKNTPHSSHLPFSLHLYPWQRATWPGTEQEVTADEPLTVAEKLGLDHSAYISVSVHQDQTVDSWMPVLNSEVPDDGSLLSIEDCMSRGSDLVHVLTEIQRHGRLTALVRQLQDVLQTAVQKRVHNVPCSCLRQGNVGSAGDPQACCDSEKLDQNCEHSSLDACSNFQLQGVSSALHSVSSGSSKNMHSTSCWPEAQTDHQREAQTDHQREAQTDHQREAQTDHQREPQTDHQPEVQTDHQREAQTDHQLEAQTDHQREPQTDHQREAQTDHQPEVQTDHQPEVQTDHQREAQTDHQPEAQTDHQRETQTDHQPVTPASELQTERTVLPSCDADSLLVSSGEKRCLSEHREGTSGTSERSYAAVTNADMGTMPSQTSVKPAKVAILFSGGVDSTVLAALADRCVPAEEPIDLINVAFEQKVSASQSNRNRGNQAKHAVTTSHYDVPDRQTGYLALSELNPHRCWNFVEVNVTQEMLQTQRSEHVRHLVYPLNTVLDDSIGCAVWFAAQGRGVLGSGPGKGTAYTSAAKVILCGMGADEQLAGYSRHRIRFQQESWSGLISEVNMEIHRISARNLGRDDRIIADHGKESRFPFLDEDVVAFLASVPIHHKADLRFPRGVGEKLLLRLLALQLGLRCTSALPKRAIQFGSRIAKLEKSKEKGNHVCQRLMQE